MSDSFWLNDFKIIFKKDKLNEIWPYENMTYNQKLNATTRFILLISLVGFMLLNNYLILLLGLVLIIVLVTIYLLYKKNDKESMSNYINKITNEDKKKHTQQNPMYNVMMTDYKDNPQKEEESGLYNETKENLINTETKKFILENNKDNKDINKIFNNLGDNMNFEQSMRQFYINPSTTIPNNQDDFLKFCYNDLYSEKPLIVY